MQAMAFVGWVGVCKGEERKGGKVVGGERKGKEKKKKGRERKRRGEGKEGGQEKSFYLRVSLDIRGKELLISIQF